jgi:hypothetical protein
MNRAILWLLVVVAVICVAAAVKVSELPSASSVSLTDVVPVVVGNVTKKVTVGRLGDAIVARSNPYTGSFTGGSVSGDSLTVSGGVTPPFYGSAVASIGANTVFGLRLHSEQNNGLFASSRNGQAAKFVQEGWGGETYNTPVVRVARATGSLGVNHSPLLMLETPHSEWSDGDAILVRRDGADMFRLTAAGVVHGQGLVLPQFSEIPADAVPAGSSSVTNWMLVNVGGIPTFVATNHAEGGWLQKPLWP